MKNEIKLGIIASTVVLSGIFIIQIIMCLIPDSQERGQFGDMFGTLNPFFSGLAFIGLIYTILVQREENTKQIVAVQETNRLTSLATLISIYSEDEEKYKGNDADKSEKARVMKEKLMERMEKEYLINLT